MNPTLSELHAAFLRAVQFFNDRLEQQDLSEDMRSALRLKVLSPDEFSVWWSRISEDRKLQARWLERFEDPEQAFTRACQRVAEELKRISIKRSAA